MSEPKACFQCAADVLDGWRDDVLTGKGPVLYPVGSGELSRIEVGPGLVTLIGGPPGCGKTALTMQWTVDALRLTPTLRAMVCNIEMPPPVLLDRQLARLSGVDLSTIRHRRLTAEHADRIDQGLNTLEVLAERLCFIRPPYDLANVAVSADAFEAGLLVLDYIQRIPPPGEHENRRGSVDATVNYLRQFADAGVAVIVVAAVARTKDAKGRSSYAGDGLNLASYRESSELEFGADDAFILAPDPDTDDLVILKHLKSRHGEPLDMTLHFERRCQRFMPVAVDQGKASSADRGKLRSALAALWNRTPAADDDQGDDDA
jgi:replicative DNA helicase